MKKIITSLSLATFILLFSRTAEVSGKPALNGKRVQCKCIFCSTFIDIEKHQIYKFVRYNYIAAFIFCRKYRLVINGTELRFFRVYPQTKVLKTEEGLGQRRDNTRCPSAII